MSQHEAQHRLEEHIPQVVDGNAAADSVGVVEHHTDAITWIKRGLVAGAIAGVAYGGYESATHFDEVKTSIQQNDAWAGKTLLVTEGLAWGSTPFILGSAAHKIGKKKIKFSDVPNRMRELEHSKTFQASMWVNSTAALGTASVLVAGAESLPASARPLAYGVAAGSVALSAIPIKAGYMFDKRKQRNA